jgi:hypothetical protein
MVEIFESAVRSKGDLAGVFEYDGETGYFYLYTPGNSGRILDSIHVFSGKPDFARQDIAVRWNRLEQMVGLFIRGELWALFAEPWPTKYGGNYSPGGTSPVQVNFEP